MLDVFLMILICITNSYIYIIIIFFKFKFNFIILKDYLVKYRNKQSYKWTFYDLSGYFLFLLKVFDEIWKRNLLIHSEIRDRLVFYVSYLAQAIR